MAISKPHYELLKSLSAKGRLNRERDILEIGQANWYDHSFKPDHLAKMVDSAFDSRQAVLDTYKTLFGEVEIVSIDKGGDAKAIKHDLNLPLSLDRKFGTVFNHGTAEHIFDIANVFRMVHEHCDMDGVMIHEGPFTGWVDHSFYSYHPTFFYDLAAANHYRIEALAIEDLKSGEYERIQCREQVSAMQAKGKFNRSLCLFAALRKIWPVPFSNPQQGVYSGMASQTVCDAWRTNR